MLVNRRRAKHMQPEKNKLIQDLEKVDWKSLLIIGQKIGVSNFILQLLSHSLSKHKDGESNKDILNIFGLNSKILYVFKNELTDSEQDKIKTISLNHEIDFIDYERLTPDTTFEIALNTYYSHIVFDDLKALYNHKKFNGFVKKSITEFNKKIICGYQSNDKILKTTFFNYMDLIMYINSSITTESYDVELVSQLNDPKLKRTNFYFIDID